MPYDVASPFAAAAGALGGFLDAKNKTKQQDFENNLKTSADQQAQALARSQISKTDQDISASKAAVSREDLDSASQRIHTAATDALDKAKFEYSQTHDAELYKQKQEEIKNAMTLGMAQIAASKSNAQLASTTQLAVANIGATTQRRGQDISAATERRGQDTQAGTAAANRSENAREFDVGNKTTQRGQDLTLQEYEGGYRGKSSGPTSLQQAAAIRAGETTLKNLGVKQPKDPHLADLLAQFADPASRQAMLSDPNMPAETKTYLTKLGGLLPQQAATPAPVATP